MFGLTNRHNQKKKTTSRSKSCAALAFLITTIGTTNCAMPAGERATPTRTGDITAEELAGLSLNNVMEAVSLLRPRWLRARGSTSLGIVIDGRLRGSREELAQISLSTVRRIKFMSPADATTRYGLGFFSGAIVVTTGRSSSGR